MLRHQPSGVVVLSPPESSVCSSSDTTEPASPCSPESSSGPGEEGAGARMPPWVCEPARRPAQYAPRRSPHTHRRITEFFNHKMKPHHHTVKKDANTNNTDTNKCLNKNVATQAWENYISYLSQTLSPRVIFDVGKQAAEAMPKTNSNEIAKEIGKATITTNGMVDFGNQKEKVHSTVNGYIPNNKMNENTEIKKRLNTIKASKETKVPKSNQIKNPFDPSANGVISTSKQKLDVQKADSSTKTSKDIGTKVSKAKADSTKLIGKVTSTTKLDTKMNGVTSGSNNISLSPIAPKLAPPKRAPAKRTNRKSSACIANSKNLTWSKANNLKQVQLLKQQSCNNTSANSSIKNIGLDVNSSPKINSIPNGVGPVPLTVNGTINGLNVPVTNLQNCHSINLQQNNGTATSSNLASFVAMPQNVMLTTLRIPQNGITAQTVNQPNINTFNRPNLNVSSPTKLNGQFVFPYVQNINGAVVQIPNLMTKVPSFVLPQTSQITTQRQDLPNQQTAQFLINGTLVKLANTMSTTYSNVNKSGAPTSQPLPTANKTLSSVGMTVQPKQNYTVNISHPMLVQQPGFIVTSVPNINVKETWSYTSTNSSASTQQACNSNQAVQHHPMLNSFSSQVLHSSSIPIAPVKPPDNPIQGTDPPSSTVKESDLNNEKPSKCDIPWLSKLGNNNNVNLESKKLSRPFAQISNFTDKKPYKSETLVKDEDQQFKKMRLEKTVEEIRRVEEVARREETIFSQITVLKDVTSSVHSAMIESNYSSATTESSESGIGTDKSIDSPADSQASKECDEDSAISLSVSVCSGEAQDCQKSPILKEPKTIRFPVKSVIKSNDKRKRSTDTTRTALVCLWESCKQDFDSDSSLLEHLQVAHVETQANKEHYVCHWEQCKVKGKPSCSQLWLNRHVLSHGGNKPFKCIFDCGRRFSTQTLLERHVNNHFNIQSSSSNGTKKTADSTPKLIRRNGKKLRYRRQPWSARMFDFFDSGIMEGLAWRLARATRWRLGGACPLREPPGRHTVTLTSTLLATRRNPRTGAKEALVSYYPPNVIDDEWVPEKEVKRTKRVEISELPPPAKVSLYSEFCGSWRSRASPPPAPAPAPPPPPARVLPPRNCASSRVLHTLLQQQKRDRELCPAPYTPLILPPDNEPAAPSGARKRKMGRRHGGNAFWPCGR